jgi:hypothetical protein
MASQAQMTDDIQADDSPSAVNRLGGLTHDIIELFELQFRLFAADCSIALWRVVFTVVAFLAGFFVFAGSIPLLFAAVAALLFTATGMPIGWACFLAALIGFLTAAGLIWASWRFLRQAGKIFQRSGHEFSRNLHWLKESLQSSNGSNSTH